MPMTVSEVLQQIHRLYEGNTDYPSSGSDDYNLRLGLINDAIKEWETFRQTRWKELYATTSLTTVSGTSQYSLPSDFKEIASLVYIDDLYYKIVRNDMVKSLQEADSTARFCWITGTPTAYQLNVNPEPDESGKSIELSYYKYASSVSNDTDVLPMSMPMFVSYWVVARLYDQDGNGAMTTYYEQKANDVMSAMIDLNENIPYEQSGSLLDNDTNYTVFGEKL